MAKVDKYNFDIDITDFENDIDIQVKVKDAEGQETAQHYNGLELVE